MLRPAAIALGALVILAPQGFRGGCRDATRSLTSIEYGYYGTRDMRRSVALMPQKGYYRLPDSTSVPITGYERVLPREVLEATLVDPTPQAGREASIQRGEIKFQRTCTPCHSKTMAGDGPVSAMFIPPPDMLAETTRGRSDGFIYSYIRHGGAVMPSYGAQVTPAEAWDLIHYIRHMQQTSPR